MMRVRPHTLFDGPCTLNEILAVPAGTSPFMPQFLPLIPQKFHKHTDGKGNISTQISRKTRTYMKRL